MISRTLGGSPNTVTKRRDFAVKHQAGNARPKSKGGDGKYHLNGRPWTRPGNETDK